MSYPRITFTITTSRRLELFMKTMETFNNSCMDKDLIDRWVLSDDRSSPSDLEMIKKRYPFFQTHRSPKPGQAANVNHLFSLVETEWFFHCEDDWEFIHPGRFIREMFDVALSDIRIKNVVLRHWSGLYVKDGELEYRAHFFKRSLGKESMKRADACWWGYSLNPGLQHKPTVDELPKYDENFNVHSRFWDRPAAITYHEKGLKRVNLMKPYIKHIGENNPAYAGD